MNQATAKPQQRKQILSRPPVKQTQPFKSRRAARRRPLMPLSVNGLPILTPQRIAAGIRGFKHATQEESARFFGVKLPPLCAKGDLAEAEKRMLQVWARWHKIEAEEQSRPSTEQEADDSQDRKIAKRLYDEFPKESEKEIRAALWWRQTIIRRVLTGQHVGGRVELDYGAYDGSPFNVVLCRTWREIKADCPTFWVKQRARLPAGFDGHVMATAPTFAWIAHLWQRYHEYGRLRQDAEGQYRGLIYTASFYRPSSRAGPPREKPAANQRQRKEAQDRIAATVAKRASARYTAKGGGGTNMPNKMMPDHIRVACDAARGVIEDDRLVGFLRREFLDLPKAARQEFLKIYDAEPIMRRGMDSLIVQAWLLDNAPVFHRYQWHWDAIHAAVAARFKKHRLTVDAVKTMWNGRPIRYGEETMAITLDAVEDSAPMERRLAQPHAELLTPPPSMP